MTRPSPALWSLLVLLLTLQASAFDTGHHFDLTWAALHQLGFQERAIQSVQVCNWLTDYHSNHPSPLGDPERLRPHGKQLHCDNLFSHAAVLHYHGQLAKNTREALHQCAQSGNRRRAVAILGTSLHVVQDFYSHSNWVDEHSSQPDSFSSETLFSRSDGNYFTGAFDQAAPTGMPDHGGYGHGQNRDAAARPGWEQAYVSAFMASRQWVGLCQEWVQEVEPNFWSQLQNYSPEAGLEADLEAAEKISLWVKTGDANGHWKGEGSGDSGLFVKRAASWAADADSTLVRSFKEDLILETLAVDLYATPKLLPPQIARSGAEENAVVLRTQLVKEDETDFFETRVDGLAVPTGPDPDYYAIVTLGDQVFKEAVQQERKRTNPPWASIAILPKSVAEVKIRYELWDEDFGSQDDPCDIYSGGGVALDLFFQPTTLLVSGDKSGNFSQSPLRAEGDDEDRAIVEFTVKSIPIR